MKTTWAELIRVAVTARGNLLAVSRESGVGYGRVHRFVVSKRGINIDNAERLARVVGLELRRVKRTKGR